MLALAGGKIGFLPKAEKSLIVLRVWVTEQPINITQVGNKASGCFPQ